MKNRPYRIIQWATGKVGIVAIRHFVDNPAFTLAGVYVTDPAKVGKDAGKLAGIESTGITATDDVEAVLAMDADCVLFAPARQDVDMVCRLLRSGKNVVSPLGPFYRTERSASAIDRIAAACRDGGSSFHGSGIHPGFAGDILPLALTRIMERVDHIHIFEVVDQLANPSNYIDIMGFGRSCEDLLANPSRSADAPYFFAESMALVAETLGTSIERLTTKLEVSAAVADIVHPRGVVKAGTVAGQHYEWTGWADGRPLISYHFFWTMGDSGMTPQWDCGPTGYRVLIEGNPQMELRMPEPEALRGGTRYISMWTAMACVNVIPAVCDAQPSFMTHRDLGLPQTLGQVRSDERAM